MQLLFVKSAPTPNKTMCLETSLKLLGFDSFPNILCRLVASWHECNEEERWPLQLLCQVLRISTMARKPGEQSLVLRMEQ